MAKELNTRATYLRRKGFTFDEIASEMKLPKSTVYGWTKDTKLTTAQNDRLSQKRYESKLKLVSNLADKRNEIQKYVTSNSQDCGYDG